ncbi:MAG: hypothetical protein UGF43_14805 [Blautia sp.]|uniref:hypothetical protein n=1 Tax=Blautia sp. TaxID=1955243 RepID=UPI002E7673E0|nr:hypothetical protein [Blautia sp.]MEE0642902.1 hypothetical protein [Blautia sp.]MEE1444859.1 hypothetical protein [Blautia sp.]
MRVSNLQILTLSKAIPDIRKKMLPIRLGFAINKNIQEVKGISEAYNEEQGKILDKYCAKDEQGNYLAKEDRYDITDWKGYNREMTELLKIENEVAVHTVPLEEVEKCGTGKFDTLTPEELELLEFMIEE